MDNSILNSTKKTLGLPPGYDAFDHDVMTHINSVSEWTADSSSPMPTQSGAPSELQQTRPH